MGWREEIEDSSFYQGEVITPNPQVGYMLACPVCGEQDSYYSSLHGRWICRNCRFMFPVEYIGT